MKFQESLRWAEVSRDRMVERSDSGYSRFDKRGALRHKARRINRAPGKRSLDITVAAFALIFLLPAFLAIALAIKLSSRGPVFFRQERYGAGGRIFKIYKFRTMNVIEANGSFQQASRNDPRVTAVGAWLRRSSMDELPQLINVLAGSMSLVGPRPHATAMDDYYSAIIPDFSLRHLVRPGLTGFAQVSGYRGPTNDMEAIRGRLSRDVAYIHNWSLLTDIVILARTPSALVGQNAF
jgi:putative colanic acid biosynthesis UDP-glucose lipid carrier transferase